MDKIRRADLHAVGQQAFDARLKLKPVVVALGIALGTAGGLSACGDGNGSSGHVINTSGGAGHSPGGDGGDIHLYLSADNAVIEVLAGRAGMPAMSAIPTPDFGANPWVPSASMTVLLVEAEPGVAGTPYQWPTDCRVYLSDGDPGEDGYFTGIDIQKGVTLTLESDCLETENDLRNDGALMPAGSGASIHLYMDNYIGSGSIDTSGSGTGEPDAGAIEFRAAGSFYNSGNMSAVGADSAGADGGAGGSIDIVANGENLWNSGTLDNRGGSSTFPDGVGGNTSSVILELRGEASGSLISAGEIIARAGDGESGGGTVDPVEVLADIGDYEVHVAASIHAEGGDGTGSPAPGGGGGNVIIRNRSSGGRISLHGFGDLVARGGSGSTEGGDGGEIELYSDGGANLTVTNEADIDTRGGDATSASGQNYAGDGGGAHIFNDLSATLGNSGRVDTRGGNATSGYGGEGGFFELYATDGSLENAGVVNTSGGNGTDQGGDPGGANIGLYSEGGGSGSVTNRADITAVGGNATTGPAGNGMELTIGMRLFDGTVLNEGDLDASGGNSNGNDGGAGGFVFLGMAENTNDPDNRATNTGNLSANGGNGATGGAGGLLILSNDGAAFDTSGALSANGGKGSEGAGGKGGLVHLSTDGEAAGNRGPVSAHGGDGETYGGSGGQVEMSGEPLTNTRNIDASGGDGVIEFGGDGGVIQLFSTGDTSTDNSGDLDVSAGSGGAADGDPGIIAIDTPL